MRENAQADGPFRSYYKTKRMTKLLAALSLPQVGVICCARTPAPSKRRLSQASERARERERGQRARRSVFFTAKSFSKTPFPRHKFDHLMVSLAQVESDPNEGAHRRVLCVCPSPPSSGERFLSEEKDATLSCATRRRRGALHHHLERPHVHAQGAEQGGRGAVGADLADFKGLENASPGEDSGPRRGRREPEVGLGKGSEMLLQLRQLAAPIKN